jgi:hypothetical protein
MEQANSKQVLALIFDIPKEKNTLRVKTWRELQRLEAELKFRSLWVLPNTKRNLSDFKYLRNEIEKSGGKAEVLLFDVM